MSPTRALCRARRSPILPPAAGGAVAGWLAASLWIALTLGTIARPAAAQSGPLMLWQVRSGETETASVYVLGSVALRADQQLDFDRAVMDAFARSSSLVLPNSAVLSKQNALIGWKAHLAEGDGLANWISKRDHASYTRAIGLGGFPPGTAEVTAPWFASRMVRTADLKREGFAPEREFEVYFAHLAREGAHPKAIVALEESATSYDRHAALSRAAQAELMKLALAASKRATRTLPALERAWRNGAPDAFARAAEPSARASGSGGAAGPSRSQADVENQRLAAAIPPLLAGRATGDNAFLIADTRSLLGPEGVLARLRASGLEVRQLRGDPSLGALPAPEPPAAREIPEDAPGRVVLIGIDGATLRIATPLIAEGKLPNLARLARGGASGPLRSHRPIYSPRIWNSIATGKTPEHHGIEGFTFKRGDEPQQLYLSLHRKAHALWNIASDAGLSVGVVNWWNTYPPEIINGVMSSDHAKPTRLEELRRLTGAKTNPDEGATVYPASWQSRVDRIYAERRGLTEVRDPFLGNLGMAAWMKKEELSKRYLDDAAAARIALELDLALRPQLLMLFLPGIDRISHRLWGSIEPESLYKPHLRPNPLERAAGRAALFRHYEFSDAIIGLILRAYGPRDLVLVVSDHGFEAGQHLGDLTGVHDSENALDGVIFARGPGIAAGTGARGTSVNDVTPTILTWLGLPLGRDMDGRVASFLDPSFSRAASVATHDTGEVERMSTGPSGSEDEILDQLRALGYIE